MWNDGTCMGSVKNNDKCCRATTNTSNDFCKYHEHKHKYNTKHINSLKINDDVIVQLCEKYKEFIIINSIIKKFAKEQRNTIMILNKKHMKGLLNIYDNWDDIPIMYWIYINKCWWDIRILINIFTAGINQSDMESPYPVYPMDPYTRKLIQPNELKKLKKHCDLLKIELNNALNIFLTFSVKILTKFYDTPQTERVYMIVDMLSKRLRYKLINYKNSQDCYCGYWVFKKEKKSTFEQLYYVVKNTPIYCGTDGSLIGDPHHLYAMVLINELKQDQYNLETIK